ncbi:MAG: uroporphyrinogen-III C-methyltransferase [Rhodobacteraceae bacterium]|nr:uroporphyrinogen-III C-methyltransferase [Paracoccaceae bacterium]
MDFLPIFLDIRGKKVVVDGGGTVAARRVERALSAGANVQVFNAELCDEFQPLIDHPHLAHFARDVRASDVEGSVVAYGTSEDENRDLLLFSAASQAGALANVADVNAYCDFVTPSVVDRSPLVVAITSGGTAPVIARILRARIESVLPPAYGRMSGFLGQFRAEVMSRIKKTRARRRFWESMIDGSVGDKYLAGDEQGAKEQLLSALRKEGDGEELAACGEVYLVGAGPGDPDLLTFRALRLMQRADVVLYDRLVGTEILDLIRRDAERIYVGKQPKQHTMLQEEISNLMVKLAQEGKRVLRLKGGDPFIFGRGAEEIETIAERGIPFQVVPGITAASGCSAYSGIPLTHRDYAQSCVFATAHGRDGVLGLDWDVLLRPNQTVAIYMGLSCLGELVEQFINRGVDPEVPAAVVDRGTLPEQKIVVAPLGDITNRAKTVGLTGPAMIIIGEVVSLRDKLKWYSEQHEDRYSMSVVAKNSL